MPHAALIAATGLACAPKPATQEPAQPTSHHHQHHGGMPHRFEDADAWAKEFDSPERLQWQRPDEVVASLGLRSDASVADIGAGTGYFAVRFAKALPQGKVFASDIEPDMVRYLRERAQREELPNLVAVQGTAEDPKLPEPVDVLFLCNVYHHIEDRAAFFGRLVDSLEPDGALVLVDFKKDAPEEAPGPPEQHRVSHTQMADELARVGWLHVATDTELLPYQYIAVFTASSRPTPTAE